ncbi:MAG TPA: NAD(P)H-hydrate epimerase, partial [Flavobacteriales bacterium]|nr:NAD(P)H-hydrate epimerase [Flavobacteriales bacterium]
MIPVLGPSALRAADDWTIEQEHIGSWELMERASRAFAQHYESWLQANELQHPAMEQGILVLCGMGNNGGDGLAIARMLHGMGYGVRAIRLWHRSVASADNERNFGLAKEAGVSLTDVSEATGFPEELPQLIIDALFGTGINKGADDWVAEVIERINRLKASVVAVDIPSGLFAQPIEGEEQAVVLKATATFTFETPKLAFYFAENSDCVGGFEVLPIGLDRAFIAREVTAYHQLEERDVLMMLRPRPRFAHKGTFGHALVIAGNEGHMGAAILATRGALRSGVGLVTAMVPDPGVDAMRVAVPEAMCVLQGDAPPTISSFAAVVIGPGLGIHPASERSVKNLVQTTNVPTVFDADALNVLAA